MLNTNITSEGIVLTDKTTKYVGTIRCVHGKWTVLMSKDYTQPVHKPFNSMKAAKYYVLALYTNNTEAIWTAVTHEQYPAL